MKGSVMAYGSGLVRAAAMLGYFVGLTACNLREPPIVESQPLLESAWEQLDGSMLAGKKIEEALIVVFRDGLEAREWTRVFGDSRELMLARQRMTSLSHQISDLESRGVAGPELETLKSERDDWIPRVGEILARVYESSAYLAAWDSSLQCEFSAQAPVTLACRGDVNTQDNPLLGGVPQARAPIQVVSPEFRTRTQRPAFGLELFSSSSEAGEGSDGGFGVFSLQLLVRPDPDLSFLTGSVEPSAGSYFMKSGVAIRGANRGYVELRIAR